MVRDSIAHYEILGKIGEGGMGVVYKARDTHLERLVAIKVLPKDKVADPERKRRFIQEARAASALNHPNIITVHDIACEDGLDFMVMEFVPGKTLDQAIGRQRMKLGDVLKCGAQIADALAAAHSAGIVHRDLKPANVMVTETGLVKVLDFGLAKLVEPATSGLTVTQTSLNQERTVVGTAAYMSPEQVEGREVDPRSDIFAFGNLLYEMVTGRRAFRGDSSVAVLAAILETNPEPVSAIAPRTPSELQKLIARCLRKEPERRLQHIGDAKLILEELKEEYDSGMLQRTLKPPSRARLPISALVAVMVVVLAAVAGAIWRLTRPGYTAPAPTLTRLTWDPDLTMDPAISTDGRLLAYASDRSGEGNLDIYVQQVGGGAPLRLTNDPADETEPSFSPDGTAIAFRSEKEGGGIYIVSALGGTARLLATGGRNPQFSPDGSWIAYWTGVVAGASLSVRKAARIYVVPASGGPPRQIQPDFVAAAYPIWSPDSKHLLFLGNRDSAVHPEQGIDWWVAPLEGGPPVNTGALEATRAAKLSGPLQVYSWALLASAWQPDGSSLIFSARSGDSTNLWRLRISPETFKAAGTPQRLTSGSTLEQSPSLALGPGGSIRVAFASLNQNLSIWSLPIEPNQGRVVGEVKRLTRGAADDFHPALTSDGGKVVFISTRSGHDEVWTRDMRTGEESAISATSGMKYAPRFSPDGSKVGFADARTWNTYVMSASGGPPEMVCEGCGQLTGWSSDGKWILANALDGRITLLNLESRRKTPLITSAGHWVCCGRFSPDDRWISFLDSTSGFRTRAGRFNPEQPVVEESTVFEVTEGDQGYWSPEGNLIYTFSSRDGYVCIWAQRLDPVTKRPAAAPFAVFHAHKTRFSLDVGKNSMGIGRDKLVFSMGERTGNIWMAEWKE